jgi:hypothetical protein
MQVRIPTAKSVRVRQMSSPVETREKSFSSVVIPTTEDIDECSEPNPSDLIDMDDQVEVIKATYEDKIATLHENYQYGILNFVLILMNIYAFRAEIYRLTKLLDENLSRRSNQMAEIEELGESVGEESSTQ